MWETVSMTVKTKHTEKASNLIHTAQKYSSTVHPICFSYRDYDVLGKSTLVGLVCSESRHGTSEAQCNPNWIHERSL